MDIFACFIKQLVCTHFQYFTQSSVMAAIENLSWAFVTDVNDVTTTSCARIVSGGEDHQAITVRSTR